MRGRHTRVSIAREVMQVLEATNTKKKLLAITYNNASNNRTLTSTIKSTLEEEDCSQSSKENTIPCLAHIINLVN